MEQLPLPLGSVRRIRPLKGPRCVCCKQKLTTRHSLITSWMNLREWFVQNWDFAVKELLRQQSTEKPEIRLNPDLLWAMQAEAGYEGLELSDMLNQVIDGYLNGEFDRMQRRGKNLTLPNSEISGFEGDVSSEHDHDNKKV